MLLLWKEKIENCDVFQTCVFFFFNEYIHFLQPLILYSECSCLSQLAWVKDSWFMQVAALLSVRCAFKKFFMRTQRPDLTVEYERLRTPVVYSLATVGGTRLWLDGEVGLPLQDGVDELGVVSVHGVVSICGCHLGHGGPCRGSGNGSQRQS